jgi:hypothetical protein
MALEAEKRASVRAAALAGGAGRYLQACSDKLRCEYAVDVMVQLVRACAEQWVAQRQYERIGQLAIVEDGATTRLTPDHGQRARRWGQCRKVSEPLEIT